jgi:hypothetical protein
MSAKGRAADLELIAQFQAGNKKGKKKGKQIDSTNSEAASPEATDGATSTENPKAKRGKTRTLQRYQDLTELGEALKHVKMPIGRPEPSEDRPKESLAAPVHVLENAAILAPVGGQIDESDLRRILGDIPTGPVRSFAGYFIIEFLSEDDRRKALKKNKTAYRGGISILIGEYCEADENPEPLIREDRYARSYRQYGYDDEPVEQPRMTIGGQTQPNPGGFLPSAYREEGYSSPYDGVPQRTLSGLTGPKAGLVFGTSQQPDRPGGPVRQQPPLTGRAPNAYVPPNEREKQPVEAAQNPFDSLREDEPE